MYLALLQDSRRLREEHINIRNWSPKNSSFGGGILKISEGVLDNGDACAPGSERFSAIEAL